MLFQQYCGQYYNVNLFIHPKQISGIYICIQRRYGPENGKFLCPLDSDNYQMYVYILYFDQEVRFDPIRNEISHSPGGGI